MSIKPLQVIFDKMDPVAPMTKDEVWEELSNCVKLRISNVAQWWALSTQEQWGAKDIPNIAPPWTSFYMEWPLPKQMVVEGVVQHRQGPEIRMGVYANSRRLDSGGWEVSMTCASVKGDQVLTGQITAFCTADGTPCSPEGSTEDPSMICASESDEIARWFTRDCFPIWLAMTFCHCKNVEVNRDPQGELTAPKLVTSRRLARQVNPTNWHVLDIGPAQAIVHQAMSTGGIGMAKALHVCRGHFKHFPEGRGLFGRTSGGTYWWGPQLRGRDKGRTVRKEYNVNPPKESL